MNSPKYFMKIQQRCCAVVSRSVTSDSLRHHGMYDIRCTVSYEHRQAPLSVRILQARILEWVAMPSSRGSFHPRDETQVSRTAGRFFIPSKPPGKPKSTRVGSLCPSSSRSSQPRNRTGVSCIAHGFFTSWATREAHSRGINSKYMSMYISNE